MNMRPIFPKTPVCFMSCCQCERKVDSRTGYADLDGKAFAAYYCDKCAQQHISAWLAEKSTPENLERAARSMIANAD